MVDGLSCVWVTSAADPDFEDNLDWPQRGPIVESHYASLVSRAIIILQTVIFSVIPCSVAHIITSTMTNS